MDPARFVFPDETGIVAPLVLDGPMTGPGFRAYAEEFLAPALVPGDVVVLDNLAAHKVGAHEPRNRFSRRGALRSMRTADDQTLLSSWRGSTFFFQQPDMGNAG
jgi:hypothetical protein